MLITTTVHGRSTRIICDPCSNTIKIKLKCEMSCNLLNMKPGLRGSSTLSEMSSVSEKTSLTDLNEDLRNLVMILGLAGVEDLYQERFRVDRKKLEHMILGDDEAPEPADTFFHKIMEETNTIITWPAQLKIGAKSKKDPHVKIAGRPEDVRAAKEKVLSVLDSKNIRVTMKMDISYTGHSHIIGKGGIRIKHVMTETRCHIHFPDSNRSNQTEKSNQVSIAGEVAMVELARQRVRNLTPLIFTFELPIMSCSQNPPDVTSPYVIGIEQRYNVEVMLRTRPKLHATLVIVKGAEWEVQQVKEATVLLIQHMCENLANQILVQMTMEISPCHHPVILGRNGSNLKTIMQNTSTQILFPDANDPNIPSIRKSHVTITGTIHNVYLARQQLMGSLPLVLMFDLPENLSHISSEQITQFMSSLDVFINIRHKAKQNTLGVIIKGVERNASNIYEARHQLLNLPGLSIKANIPSSYLPNPNSNPENSSNSCQHSTNNNSNSFLAQHWSTCQSSTGSFLNTNFLFPPQYLYPSVQQPTTTSLCDNSQSKSSLGFLSSYSAFNYDHSVKDSGYSSVNNSSDSISPICSPCSKSSIYPDMSAGIDLNAMFSDAQIKETSGKHCGISNLDYNQRRLAACNAMQDTISGYRVPTSLWSGYGLSATSPSAFGKKKETACATSTSTEQDMNMWLPPVKDMSPDVNVPSTSGINMNMSNYVEHTPENMLQQIELGKWKDLSSLLTSLGLEKYIKMFVSHEVDLSTFATLTEKDLLEIGVTTVGARRKIRLVISELKKRAVYSGSAAPGAERGNSSCSSTPASAHSVFDKGW